VRGHYRDGEAGQRTNQSEDGGSLTHQITTSMLAGAIGLRKGYVPGTRRVGNPGVFVSPDNGPACLPKKTGCRPKAASRRYARCCQRTRSGWAPVAAATTAAALNTKPPDVS